MSKITPLSSRFFLLLDNLFQKVTAEEINRKCKSRIGSELHDMMTALCLLVPQAEEEFTKPTITMPKTRMVRFLRDATPLIVTSLNEKGELPGRAAMALVNIFWPDPDVEIKDQPKIYMDQNGVWHYDIPNKPKTSSFDPNWEEDNNDF